MKKEDAGCHIPTEFRLTIRARKKITSAKDKLIKALLISVLVSELKFCTIRIHWQENLCSGPTRNWNFVLTLIWFKLQ